MGRKERAEIERGKLMGPQSNHVGMREFVPTTGASTYTRALTFAMALLAFVVHSTTTRATPNCDENYKRAIQTLETSGDFDSADILRSLRPIDVLGGKDLDEVICRVWLTSDLVSWYAPGPDADSENYFEATVFVNGVRVGGIVTDSDKPTIVNRIDLKPPYHLPSSLLLRTSQNYYGIDYDTLDLLRAWRTNSLLWLWLKLISLRAYLLPLGLWCAFLFARFGKTKSPELIAKRFEDARRKGFKEIVWIGGVQWKLKDGVFSRVTRVIKRSGEDEVVAQFDRATRLEQEVEGGWPQLACAIAFPLLADYMMFSSDNPDEVIATRLFGGIFLFFSLWGIISIYFQRRGYQGIYGAMVLDPPPPVITTEDVAGQKAFGNAGIAREAESHAAASGTRARRSPVHDQEF
jgi:hypothetical protein